MVARARAAGWRGRVAHRDALVAGRYMVRACVGGSRQTGPRWQAAGLP